MLSLGLLLSAFACASAQPKRFTEHPERRAMFLVSAALAISHMVCSSAKVRGCLDIDDARCVRLVGDAVLRADRFDLKPMSTAEQKAWIKTRGERAAIAGLSLAPRREPCVVLGADRPMQEIRALLGSKPGHVCIRLASDPVPCP